MAEILSVHPVKWEGMKDHWWQFVSIPLLLRSFGNLNADKVQFMIGVLLACITIGVANILWSVTVKIIRYYKVSWIQKFEV